VAGAPTQSESGSAGCACCGNSGTGEPIEGSATVDGNVQRITVDTSAGYNPNTIRLAAGVPAEITFKQGSGCMAQVMSRDLGFFEDLTAGDVTVSLAALAPGTYGFSCGMEMVFGEIIVE
jgi:Cu+-exporting ATPase